MNVVLASAFIVSSVSGVNSQVCAPRDIIARALQDAPDAKKLMRETTKSTFFLLYHSKNRTFSSTYLCLRVAKAPFPNFISVSGVYVYGYLDKDDLWWSFKSVELNRTDEAYEQQNEFSVHIGAGTQGRRHIFQVIYTDYKHCILFWSPALGYQVWVESAYLKTNRKSPSMCSLLYDLLAPGKRHVVYIWRKCDL